MGSHPKRGRPGGIEDLRAKIRAQTVGGWAERWLSKKSKGECAPMSTAYDIQTRVNSSGNTLAELTLVEQSTNLDLNAYALDPATGDVVATIELAVNAKPEVIVEIAAKMVRAAMTCTTEPESLKAALLKHLR
jgi:hypothetical protein